jgi:CRISPR-associated protein Cas1
VPPVEDEPLPARMLNEFTYCPRLFYLEWVDREWADNEFTVDGTYRHRRTDQPRSKKAAAALEPTTPVRDTDLTGIQLTSDRLGATAKFDVLRLRDGCVIPIEYKRGSMPDVPGGVHEPELMQLALQVLLLRDAGYDTPHGTIAYLASDERVDIAVDEVLGVRVIEAIAAARVAAARTAPPPPLVDSPKCTGCSLVGICLPDELTLLREHLAVDDSEANDDAETNGETDNAPQGIRTVRPRAHETHPLYVQQQGARVGKRGDCFQVRFEGEVVGEARIREVSQIVLWGRTSISPVAIQACCERDVPICHFTYGGWMYGVTRGIGVRNVGLRIAQFEMTNSPERSLAVARGLVRSKIRNARTLIRRNTTAPDRILLRELARAAERATEARSAGELLGIEGNAAKLFFGALPSLLKLERSQEFDFAGRNRRPARDPVNALLSFLYGLLVKDVTAACIAAGLDPLLGVYHRPRHGRPALALDMAEPFRPLIADSTAITLLNNGSLPDPCWVRAAGAVSLSATGRKAVIAAHERRMRQEVRHPIFGYTISYRQTLEVQARLLGRVMRGEIDDLPAFETR